MNDQYSLTLVVFNRNLLSPHPLAVSMAGAVYKNRKAVQCVNSSDFSTIKIYAIHNIVNICTINKLLKLSTFNNSVEIYDLSICFQNIV